MAALSAAELQKVGVVYGVKIVQAYILNIFFLHDSATVWKEHLTLSLPWETTTLLPRLRLPLLLNPVNLPHLNL
jgi:hypothetical protein